MPFQNPVVGGTALVRAAIKSPNYVPGVAGWSINRDGTAEFSSATIRGNVVVVGSSGEIDITVTGGLPTIFFYNVDKTQYGFINLGDASTGRAYLGVNSGQFTTADFPGKTIRARLYMAPSPGLQNINETDGFIPVGGSLVLQTNLAKLAYKDVAGINRADIAASLGLLLMEVLDSSGNELTTIAMDTTTIVQKANLNADGVRFKVATTFLDWTGTNGVWTALTLGNGWVNTGGANANASFLIDALGNICLRGAVTNGTKTDGTVMATLPAGVRPTHDVVISVGSSTGGTPFEPNIRVRAATGNIEIWGMSTATSGSHSWDGIKIPSV